MYGIRSRLDHAHSTWALCVISMLVMSCLGASDRANNPDGAPIAFDRRSLVENLGTNVVMPTLTAFESEASALTSAVDAWCADGASIEDVALQDAARAAWRRAASVWQVAELMYLGPTGMELHDFIYSWPLVNTCAVDQDVSLWYGDPATYDIRTRLSNRRGLPALEYVLFAPSLDGTCPPQTAPAGWSDLGAAQRKAARCGFARVAAADLAANASLLADSWRSGYLAQFISSGDSGAFNSAQEALNAIYVELLYLDTDVKDMKLGEPAGIADNSCAAVETPCLAEIEARVSGHSKENVRANLEAFRLIFTGGAGSGFDDFLVALNASDLAAQMLADVDAAIAAVDAIPGTLEESLLTDRASVVAAHAAVKRVTDNLKSQFLTTLDLALPDGLPVDDD